MGNLTRLQRLGIIVAVLAIIIGFSMGGLLEDVQEGYIVVRQVPLTGTVNAQATPGVIFQYWGPIFTYKKSGTYDFSSGKEQDTDSVDGDAVNVRFNDGGTAMVSGKIRFQMPVTEQSVLKIHKDFRSYDHVALTLIKPVVDEVLTKTAAMMSTQEAYTSRKSEFAELVQDQILNGIYITESEEIKQAADKVNPDTPEQRHVVVRTKIDKATGQPVRRSSSIKDYEIKITQVSLGKEFEFDPRSQAIIESARDAFQRKIAARALAETAEQDKLKTEAEGKVHVAKANYEMQEAKIRATVKAEQEKEVAVIDATQKVEVATKAREQAEQEKLKAETLARMKLSVAELDKQSADQEKQALIARGEGQAEARRLIYQADNALEARLKTAVEIEKVWAEALSTYGGRIVPEVVFGGGGNGQGGGTFVPNGFESFMQILAAREAKQLVKDQVQGIESKAKEQVPVGPAPNNQKK